MKPNSKTLKSLTSTSPSIRGNLTPISFNSTAQKGILIWILKKMGIKDYFESQKLYKNLKDFILLVVGSILIILAFVYIFFIRKEQLTIQDFTILIGYILAFIAGKKIQ